MTSKLSGTTPSRSWVGSRVTRRGGSHQGPKMRPPACRIGWKTDGRPEVTASTEECAGACLSMLRCSHRPSRDVERGASIRCQLASSRHSTDQARSVGRRRRRSSTFSRSSFPTSTRIRDTSPTPLMPPVTLVATRTEPAPRRPDEPQAHPAGIETATSRFARCFHLPLRVRSRPAALLRPC